MAILQLSHKMQQLDPRPWPQYHYRGDEDRASHSPYKVPLKLCKCSATTTHILLTWAENYMLTALLYFCGDRRVAFIYASQSLDHFRQFGRLEWFNCQFHRRRRIKRKRTKYGDVLSSGISDSGCLLDWGIHSLNENPVSGFSAVYFDRKTAST